MFNGKTIKQLRKEEDRKVRGVRVVEAKIPQLSQWDVVEIIWEDAIHTSNWQWLNDFDWSYTEGQLLHSSIGYVVRSDSQMLSICQTKRMELTHDKDQSIDEMQHLTWGMIKEVKVLRKAKYGHKGVT